jgi:acyl-CoA reductase-like NAD-dependent aldehyde dehydrogenase
LTPTEAEADLTSRSSTAGERLRAAHRDHITANTRLAIAEREHDLATAAVTEAANTLKQAKRDLIDDTIGSNYGAHS